MDILSFDSFKFLEKLKFQLRLKNKKSVLAFLVAKSKARRLCFTRNAQARRLDSL